MTYGLSDPTIQKINAVFSRYPQVKGATIYGSRAKGNYKNGSDIDLSLSGGDGLTHSILLKIMDDLDDLLLPYTMDLSLFTEIDDPDVLGHIQRAGVPFYKRT